VAHAHNLSYSGDRDQEDCSSKPAWANNLRDPISKKPTQGVGLEFQLQFEQTNKQKKKERKKERKKEENHTA
jgi:hypothetical protein